MTEHWAEQEDLLEEFVLGRLPADRLREFGEHLRVCRECRDLVEKEQRFAAGVRRHALMKEVEQLRVMTGAGQRSPWGVVRIAASIAVLVGAGILGRILFFGTRETPPQETVMADRMNDEGGKAKKEDQPAIAVPLPVTPRAGESSSQIAQSPPKDARQAQKVPPPGAEGQDVQVPEENKFGEQQETDNNTIVALFAADTREADQDNADVTRRLDKLRFESAAAAKSEPTTAVENKRLIVTCLSRNPAIRANRELPPPPYALIDSGTDTVHITLVLGEQTVDSAASIFTRRSGDTLYFDVAGRRFGLILPAERKEERRN